MYQLKIIPSGPLRVNTYIVSNGGEAAIIDPGQRNPLLFDYIAENPFNYKYLILTHGHFDHIIEAAAVKKVLPEIKICIHEADSAALLDDEVSLYRSFSTRESEHVSADILLHGGEKLPLSDGELEIIATPGHSRGGITIKCGDMLFTGDTLFHRSVGRTDFLGGDFDELVRSVKTLFALEGDYRVLPGHEGETVLSEERTKNPFVTVNVESRKGKSI